MTVLGRSAHYHDSAAVLVKNGEIVAAAQEKRFTRKNMIHLCQRMQLSIALEKEK